MNTIAELHRVFQAEGLRTPEDYKICDESTDGTVGVCILTKTLLVVDILYGVFGVTNMSFPKIYGVFSEYYYNVAAEIPKETDEWY